MAAVRSYNVLGAFLRNEFTNMHGKPRLAITPLMMALYKLRAMMRHEVYAKEWISNSYTPQAMMMSSKLKFDRIILIIYLPLVNVSVLFIEEPDNSITVIPCAQRFISSENDYDPASIYFYRIVAEDNKPVVKAMCRDMFEINDILERAHDNISYSYLMATYVDMFENILDNIDTEYQLSYMIPYREDHSYND